MCQALFSLKIVPATEDEVKALLLRLQTMLAGCLYSNGGPSPETSDKTLNLVFQMLAKPSIRAHARSERRDALSTTLRRAEELVARRDAESASRLIEGLWALVNRGELDAVLIGDFHPTRIN